MLHAILTGAVLRSIPITTVLVLAPGSSASGITGITGTACVACVASIACTMPRVHRRLMHITDYLNKLLTTDLEHKPLLPPPSRSSPILAAFLIAAATAAAATAATTAAAAATGDRSTKDTRVLLVDKVDGGLQVTCERLNEVPCELQCQVSGLRTQVSASPS